MLWIFPSLWQCPIIKWNLTILKVTQLTILEVLFDGVVGGFGIDFVLGNGALWDFANKVKNDIALGIGGAGMNEWDIVPWGNGLRDVIGASTGLKKE